MRKHALITICLLLLCTGLAFFAGMHTSTGGDGGEVEVAEDAPEENSGMMDVYHKLAKLRWAFIVAAGTAVLFFFIHLELKARVRAMTVELSDKNTELEREVEVRREAEEELRRHEEHLEEMVEVRTRDLRESEEQYRGVFDTVADGLIIFDPEGIIAEANPAACRMYGYDREEFVGRPAMDIVSPDCLQVVQDFKKDLADRGTFHAETRHVRKNGALFDVEVDGANFIYGARHHLLAAVRDITERKEAEEKILEANTKLQLANEELKAAQIQLVQSQKMASLGRLAAGMAHEFNNPIGAVLSSNGTLKTGLDRFEVICTERPTMQKVLQAMRSSQRVIEEGARRVSEIVNRLKTFARLDEAELQRSDVHQALEATIAIFESELRPDIELRRDFDELPPITCYPARLNQLFLQLLRNANQALEQEEEGEIIIRTRLVQDAVHASVSDTGRGIPREDLDQIFDPGFTTWGVGVGVGIGLSICYQIAQEHHGRIDVESEVGKGSTFTVILPLDLETRIAASS